MKLRLLALLVLAAILPLFSVTFCTQMGTMMVGMENSLLSSIDHMAMDCTGHPQTLPCASEHMQTFLQALPIFLIDSLIGLLLLAAIVVVFASRSNLSACDPLQERSRQFFRRLRFFSRRSVFVFALSQGIIHPKWHQI